MSDQFINPITTAFYLLEHYRTLLGKTLKEEGLSESDTKQILDTSEVDKGLFISLNRQYQQGSHSFADFCMRQNLARSLPDHFPKVERLFVHQEQAIQSILDGQVTILSTGTGSGKTESFMIPILHHCLLTDQPGIKALVIYPMNALANDQVRRIKRALENTSIRVELFTGTTSEEERKAIRANPPDILITNYVMLDRLLTRPDDHKMFKESSDSLRYVVVDEVHYYRGSRATHLKYLLARLRSLLATPPIYIGTSATLRKRDVDGYVGGDDDALNTFVQNLFGGRELSLC